MGVFGTHVLDEGSTGQVRKEAARVLIRGTVMWLRPPPIMSLFRYEFKFTCLYQSSRSDCFRTDKS